MAEYQRKKREEEEQERSGKGRESQKFFAGGSEHRFIHSHIQPLPSSSHVRIYYECMCGLHVFCSGQLISGPPRKKVDAKELASDVFAAAKR